MTVICADPSTISLYSLKRMITGILPDAEIHLCKRAEKAVRIAEKEGCDILITEIDFGREKGEGIRMAEKISDTVSDTNIIFTTGAPCIDYAALILKMKFSGYLTKPFSTEELRKELMELRFQRGTEEQGSFDSRDSFLYKAPKTIKKNCVKGGANGTFC